MKVILLKDVAKVGQQGSVVEVADGFALNKLIPGGFAAQATADKLKQHEAHQKELKAEHDKKQAEIEKAVQALEGKRVEITARATEKGGLFKSLAEKDIAVALKGAVPESAIQLPKHIKETGEHKVSLVSGNAKAQVTVVVKAA